MAAGTALRHTAPDRIFNPERNDPNMRTITTSRFGTYLVTTILTAALVAPATMLADSQTAHPVPFKGSIQMVESVVVEFPTLFSVGIGTGEATQLGRFTVTRQSV